jgi:hypothetical protein
MAHYSHATRLDPRKLIGYFPDLVSRSNSVNRAVPQPPITYAEILKRNGQGQNETRVKELTALAKSFLMRYLEDIKRQRKLDPVTLKVRAKYGNTRVLIDPIRTLMSRCSSCTPRNITPRRLRPMPPSQWHPPRM